MDIRPSGNTGLQLSRLGLGTLTWGRDTPIDEANAQIHTWHEAGGTVIDTSPFYAGGGAQKLLGELLRQQHSRRDWVIISRGGGTRRQIDGSRHAMLQNLDDTLADLGTDYLDLWLVNGFDGLTPIAESLSALEIALSSGRVRYVGVTNYPAWATAYLLGLSTPGFGLAAVAAEYSLLQRQPELELLPMCQHLGLGFVGWSSLARGVLTGKYQEQIPPDSRGASAHLAKFVAPYLRPQTKPLLDALRTAAQGLNATMAQVALAWASSAPGVSCALIGARTNSQLQELLSTRVELAESIRAALTEVTAPAMNDNWLQ